MKSQSLTLSACSALLPALLAGACGSSSGFFPDTRIFLFDVQARKWLEPLRGGERHKLSVALAPQDDQVLSVSGTSRLFVWNLQGKRRVSQFAMPRIRDDVELYGAKFLPHGKSLAIIGADVTRHDQHTFSRRGSVYFVDWPLKRSPR